MPLNLTDTPILDLIKAFDALEGPKFYGESSRRGGGYSILSALVALEAARTEATKQANKAFDETKADWSTTYRELLRDFTFVIYGNGGWHRFLVNGQGTIFYSDHHGKSDTPKARELGFDIR